MEQFPYPVVNNPELEKEAKSLSGGWNYRVARKKLEGEEYEYFIVEAYYSQDKRRKKPTAITERAVEPWGESARDVLWDVLGMLLAFSRPVIDYDTLKDISDDIAPIEVSNQLWFEVREIMEVLEQLS